MPYKDPEKQKEAWREARKRAREKAKGMMGMTNETGMTTVKGLTEQGMTEQGMMGMTPGITSEVTPTVTPVEPEGVTPRDDLLSRLSKIEERLTVAEQTIAEYRTRLEELTTCLEVADTPNARPAARRCGNDPDELPFSKARQTAGRLNG